MYMPRTSRTYCIETLPALQQRVDGYSGNWAFFAFFVSIHVSWSYIYALASSSLLASLETYLRIHETISIEPRRDDEDSATSVLKDERRSEI